jgi:hypothetical protein
LWTIFFSLTSNTALIAKAFKSGSYPGLCLISGLRKALSGQEHETDLVMSFGECGISLEGVFKHDQRLGEFALSNVFLAFFEISIAF